VTIRNLRARLAAVAPGRRFIETEYGLGYRFAAGERPGPAAGERPGPASA
jgi:DNA-binding winged helix-turn-helix (wHTH) protein